MPRAAATIRAARTSPHAASGRSARIPVTPAAPTGAGASGATSAALTVSWTDASTAPTAATSFRVERSATGTGSWASVGTPAASPFTDTGLALSTTYYYRVVAVNSAGDSAPSATASGTTLSTPSYDQLAGFLDRLRAESAATTDGAGVGSWAGDTGAVTATQAASGQQMVYDATKGLVVGPRVGRIASGVGGNRYFAVSGLTLDRRGGAVFFVLEGVNLGKGTTTGGGAVTDYHTYLEGTGLKLRHSGDRDATATWGKLAAHDGTNSRVSASPPRTSRCLVGFVLTPTEVRFYVNGDYTTASPLAAGTVTASALFGDSTGDYPLQAGVKDVLFYTQPVADADVQATIVPWAATRGVHTGAPAVNMVVVGDSLTDGVGQTVGRNWLSLLTLPGDVMVRLTAQSGAVLGPPPGNAQSFLGQLAYGAASLEGSLVRPGSLNVLVVLAQSNDSIAGFTSPTWDGAVLASFMQSFIDNCRAMGFNRVVYDACPPRGADYSGTTNGYLAGVRTAMLAAGTGASAGKPDFIIDWPGSPSYAAGWPASFLSADGAHWTDAGAADHAAVAQATIDAALTP